MSLAQFWRLGHLYVTTFFLPFALLYAVTGVGVICGYTGRVDTLRFETSSEGRPPASTMEMRALVARVLAENGQACPPGEGWEVHGRFVVGPPTERYAMLELPRGGEGKAVVTLNRPGLFNRLVFLHKAKGGKAFAVLGAAFGVALLFSCFSGVALVWGAAAMRRPLLLCALAGSVAAATAVFLSL